MYKRQIEGRTDAARRGVDACREVCGTRTTLKLILETGELTSPARIRAACRIGLTAGVDFLKTSTGKVAINATLDAATIMLDEIAAGRGLCGFKAAGGIRALAAAQAYVALAEERLGVA